LASRIIWPHGTEPIATFIYLHGFTCDGGSYLPCYDYFCQEIKVSKDDNEVNEDEDEDEDEEEVDYVHFPGLKVVLPSARKIPISCYSGEAFSAWYDYTSDYEGEHEDTLDLETLNDTIRRIHSIIDEEASLLGSTRHIFLGGASQGCAVALHAALTYPADRGGLGGVIATQGHLLSLTTVPADWASRNTPVRVFCGLADTTMPWEKWVSATYESLRESGGNFQCTLDEDVDHGDEEAEGRWIRSFLLEMWQRSELELPCQTSSD